MLQSLHPTWYPEVEHRKRSPSSIVSCTRKDVKIVERLVKSKLWRRVVSFKYKIERRIQSHVIYVRPYIVRAKLYVHHIILVVQITRINMQRRLLS